MHVCVCVCVCVFPKQQNKTINCNLTECIREEYEFGMQEKAEAVLGKDESETLIAIV